MNLANAHVQGTTKTVGIFGDPVTYTLSPKMHNAAFTKLGLDYVYVPFLVKPENLGNAVEAIRILNLAGVNVTLPHKRTILPYLDSLSASAQKIGAVNTIVNRRGKLVGENTDATGFLDSLKKDGNFNPKNKRAVILGAGGTACAMSVALLEAGVKKLVIANRTLKRAQDLVKHLKPVHGQAEILAADFSGERLLDELRDCDLLANATPTGIDSSYFPFSADKFLSADIFVFDAVYSATPLVTAAKERGAAALNGLGMLVRQGALSFSLWTGEDPPIEIMRQALVEK